MDKASPCEGEDPQFESARGNQFTERPCGREPCTSVWRGGAQTAVVGPGASSDRIAQPQKERRSPKAKAPGATPGAVSTSP